MEKSEKWETVILGPRWQVRVRDFLPGIWLRLKCPCGHEAVVSTERMHAHHPPYMRLKEIEYKFRCRACGDNKEIMWSAVKLIS
ncbi:hypothetical protein SAMN04515647_4370 [Cohaesibacter sp. ES.047]|uniref:hypothetical protein n=1 Tax=Cohaesibacter sp. ES.047 TaxID=1798205 RepID=UPI000BB7D5E3|nr:hypothetical protein [Cohaesibacter sp. ES.047]SNY94045.1 hypothetical protein SAMN04515647_4370 [Cohaesibacter sp. ES.047]